jgi:glyoxylase-like metal-dependent hydrolase (beta-lactamase superfamily II)
MIADFLRRWALPLGALALIAAAPAPAKTQAPGYFRYAVGAFEVTALYDGYLRMPIALLHGIDEKAVTPLMAHEFADVNEKGILTSVNAYLVNTGDHLVLVDAGLKGCVGEPLGHMTENLRAAGYRQEDVDTILLTHMHDDHVCGLTANDQRVFPNATVYAAEEEAAFWLSDSAPNDAKHRRADRVRRALAPYQAAKVFRTFKPGAVLLPGVTAIDTRGHTPGHTAYLFESGSHKLLVLGDIVHAHAVQFAHPEVSMAFDVDQTAAAATRAALFPRIVGERWAIAGAHLPFPGIGHLRRDGNAYVYVPVEYAPLP